MSRIAVMHELSLCRNIMEIIEEQARNHHFSHVKTVYLEVGDLTCVDKDALQFVFAVACKNTLAENAKLQIQLIPGRAICEHCQREIFALKQRLQACPYCNAYPLQIIQGDELRIKNMEVC